MSEETRTMQTADTTPTRAPEDAPALVKKSNRAIIFDVFHLQSAVSRF